MIIKKINIISDPINISHFKKIVGDGKDYGIEIEYLLQESPNGIAESLILNKEIKATNYQIDTYKKKIYIYGISQTKDEKDLVITEAKEILDVEDVIASIILVEDLRIQRE